MVYPGLAKVDYEGDYWQLRIEHVLDAKALDFVEEALYLKPLGPRSYDYDVSQRYQHRYGRGEASRAGS